MIVPKHDALLVLILSILMPGVGAWVAAYRSIDGFNCNCCGQGFGQFFTAFLIVGIVWSIIHGVHIYSKSNDYWDEHKKK